MLRKLSLLFGLVLLVSLTARAQSDADRFQLFGGYSYQRVVDSPSWNQNGWEGSAEVKISDMVGLVADFDGHYGTVRDLNSATYTFLFGPQVSMTSGRFSPFAQALIGAGHQHFTGGSGNTDTSLAWTVGVGVDYKIIPGLYWRLQAGYEPTYFFSRTQNNARVSAGLVIHF